MAQSVPYELPPEPRDIVDELKESYTEYAMSVITSRALPDIRDGLKPVHRRVIFAMNELGNTHSKAYKKSARVVGDVIGKYHPHGDSAVYEAIVRMAQPFSMRYPLVDGQGNFGSVDGDSAAAMRYTEIRMTQLCEQMLKDLSSNTVNWVDNYDGSEMIPEVLPTLLPNLLLNGGSGIAVGMATNIPPHNLNEVVDGCLAYINNPNITNHDLMQYIKGPDFPTAAEIHGVKGIYDAYTTGKGRVVMRSKYHMETDRKGHVSIVFTEIPFQVNKANVILKIAELIRDKKVEGISNIADESDKDGMRIVINIKRDGDPDLVLNHLFVNTQLQTNFSVNNVCLVNGQPRVVTLVEMIAAYIRHRYEIVTRRSLFELNKTKRQGHILEGLSVALTNIDAIIETIKNAKTSSIAKQALRDGLWKNDGVLKLLDKSNFKLVEYNDPDSPNEKYGVFDKKHYKLSESQITAILGIKLQSLTGLETERMMDDYKSILTRISELETILSDFTVLTKVVYDEVASLRSATDKRRTVIYPHELGQVNVEDLIAEEQSVVTISHVGYVKVQPVDEYNAQRRGGKGKSAAPVRTDDFIEHVIVTSNLNTLLFFTNRGRVYWKRVFELPNGSRNAKGKPIINLLPFGNGEKITAVLSVDSYDPKKFAMMATQYGTVKRVSLEEFSRSRASGIRAIDLAKGDTLIDVVMTDGKQDIMLFSNLGKTIRFKEVDVRPMGRSAKGVRGMRVTRSPLLEDDVSDTDPDDGDKRESYVTSMVVVPNGGSVLMVCENGYGKATGIKEFPTKKRGGKGMISIKTTKRNGQLVGAIPLGDSGQELLFVSNTGVVIRLASEDIKVAGRSTQGVTLMNLDAGNYIAAVAAINNPSD